MSRALRATEILTVLCPTCGARPGRRCQLASGEPRNTSHQDRRWAAKDRELDVEEVWIRPKAVLESSSGGDPALKAWNIPTVLDTKGSRYLQLAKMAFAVKKSDWK